MSQTEFTPIDSLEALQECITRHPAALIWFTAPDCRVCKDLKPRVEKLIREEFSRMKLFEVDCAASPETAAQAQVFSVPTLLIYLEGQEFIREARTISLARMRQQLQRPYTLCFDD